MSAVAKRKNPVIEDIAKALSSLCSPFNTLLFLSVTSLVSFQLFQNFAVKIAATWITVYGIKFAISRERPEGNIEHGLTPSFPSAHSATSLVIASVVSTALQGTTILLYLVAVLVGFSRIYLQSHYLSDVLAGLIIGAVVVLLV